MEACPYDALNMGSGFEAARTERSDLVITKEELISRAKRPSTWFRPQLERNGYDPHLNSEDDLQEIGREMFFWHPKRPQNFSESERKESTSQGDYE